MANLTKFWIRTRTWQKVQGTQSEDPAGHAPSQGTSPLSLAKEIEGAVRRRVAINIQFIISNF